MDPVTVVWCLSAGACLTLAVVHMVIWFNNRAAADHLAFTLAAVGVAGIGAGELLAMSARDPAEFARIVRWTHLPLTVLVPAMVLFVHLHFRTARPWLGLTVVALRGLACLLNFSIPVNLHFREITSLKQIPFLGREVSVVAEAVINPWSRVAELSSLMLLAYVLDASCTLWRRGGRDQRWTALVVGGSFVCFILAAAFHTALIHLRVIQSPYLVSPGFLLIVLAMAWQLSHNVFNATRLADELRESRDQMVHAARAANLALWRWDVPEDQIWVTSEGRSMHGLTQTGSLRVADFLAAIHPEDRESLHRAMTNSLAGDGEFFADYRLLLADGRIRWLSARGKVECNGHAQPVRMRGVSIDDSDRRQAEERARLLVEAAPYAMIMVNASGRIVLANRQAEVAFGYAREELLGRGIDLLVPDWGPAGPAGLRADCSTHPPAGGVWMGREVWGLHKDGPRIPLEIGLSAIQTSEGSFVLASISDISERLRNEREISEQRNELAHLSRVSSLGQLSGSLAHELNQPLGIILTNAQAAQRMLKAETPDLTELMAILGDIVQEDLRAGEVIKRLRALLKRGETRLVPVSLNGIVQEVLRLTRSDLIGRGITVATALTETSPEVMADSVQIQQVLLNLITNACDAMADNRPDDRLLRLSTHQSGGLVRLSLRDRGSGLPGNDALRIFQPFFTTKSSGLGIGLAISRSILVAHHGRLWAETNPDRGATLHLELPAEPPLAA